MNENIRKLALEAGGSHYPSVNTKQLEYFAKLIVKECAEVASCNGHVSGFTLGDLIKDHFGINND